MSSRHDGVSCDACMRRSFRLRRYKCLICYDYDLCGPCYDAGSETNNHMSSHPMQCMLTRADYLTFYSGDASSEPAFSYTCPLCGILGFTESGLSDHVTRRHAGDGTEVICPVCACHPDGHPNRQTFELERHLELDHRARSSGTASSVANHNPSPATPAAAGNIRLLRRTLTNPGTHVNSNNAPTVSSSNANSVISSTTNNTAAAVQTIRRALPSFLTGGSSNASNSAPAVPDPIADLLCQLSSRSRAFASVSSQLVQLEQQLESTRAQLLEHHPLPQSQPQSAPPRDNQQQARAVSGTTVTSQPHHQAGTTTIARQQLIDLTGEGFRLLGEDFDEVLRLEDVERSQARNYWRRGAARGRGRAWVRQRHPASVDPTTTTAGDQDQGTMGIRRQLVLHRHQQQQLARLQQQQHQLFDQEAEILAGHRRSVQDDEGADEDADHDLEDMDDDYDEEEAATAAAVAEMEGGRNLDDYYALAVSSGAGYSKVAAPSSKGATLARGSSIIGTGSGQVSPPRSSGVEFSLPERDQMTPATSGVAIAGSGLMPRLVHLLSQRAEIATDETHNRAAFVRELVLSLLLRAAPSQSLFDSDRLPSLP